MSLDEIYQLFPNLKERRRSQGTKLSGGEQQMLAIGRILRTGATMLLLDEPTEGLAPLYVSLLFEVIKNLRGLGLTILIVEQNVHHVLAASDRAYVLENGAIVMEGAGADLLRDERLKVAYLGL
jgi:branched-chain amino acid transport system ATP-binding protein